MHKQEQKQLGEIGYLVSQQQSAIFPGRQAEYSLFCFMYSQCVLCFIQSAISQASIYFLRERPKIQSCVKCSLTWEQRRLSQCCWQHWVVLNRHKKRKGTTACCFEVHLGNCSFPLKCKPNGKAIAPVTAFLVPLIWHIPCKCMLESDNQKALRSKGKEKLCSYFPQLLC